MGKLYLFIASETKMSKTEKEVMEKEKHPLHIVDQEIGEFKATQKIAKEFEAIITMMEILNRS